MARWSARTELGASSLPGHANERGRRARRTEDRGLTSGEPLADSIVRVPAFWAVAFAIAACTNARPVVDGGPQTTVHPLGINEPASDDFHGKLLRAEGYNFSICQRCHGDDFAGGSSGRSCLACHAEGPTACSTCHREIANQGSHAHHLSGGPLGKTFTCAECHKVPESYTDVGHIFLADGSIDPAPAEVTFSEAALAGATPPEGARNGPPTWDAATQTCTNIYCHGAAFADTAATNVQPVWNQPATHQADCGTCHGLPPNHANNSDCAMCHGAVIDHAGKIIRPDLHINGAVELAPTAKNCSACHGSATNAAPPADLSGGTDRAALGVGAHQAHLQAGALGAPVACNECHRVPAAVDSPGHLGGHAPGDDLYPAEVFPGDPTVGQLAHLDGAAPVWDGATGTCAGVYCHGGGDALGADATPGLSRSPSWTSTAGLACGTACHGAPPVLPPHTAAMTRTDCGTCHPRTVSPTGEIIISGPPGQESSAHINGVVDVAK